jgi:hypothetical protein
MARRTADLLDVFRLGSKEPDTPAPRPRRGDGPRTKSPPKASGTRFEGVFLGPRQVLLGSALVLLLCVLAFTVGVGFGKGRGAGGDAALRKDTLAWYVVGTLPRTDEARGSEVVLTQVLEDLESTYGVRRELMRARPFQEGAIRGFELYLGPFATRDQATTYWRELGLERARVRGGIPFRFPKYAQTRIP